MAKSNRKPATKAPRTTARRTVELPPEICPPNRSEVSACIPAAPDVACARRLTTTPSNIDPEKFLQQLLPSLDVRDRPRVSALCENLVRHLRERQDPFPAEIAKKVLSHLRR